MEAGWTRGEQQQTEEGVGDIWTPAILLSVLGREQRIMAAYLKARKLEATSFRRAIGRGPEFGKRRISGRPGFISSHVDD